MERLSSVASNNFVHEDIKNFIRVMGSYKRQKPYRHAHAPARRRDCGTAGAVTRHFRLVEDDEARRARFT